MSLWYLCCAALPSFPTRRSSDLFIAHRPSGAGDLVELPDVRRTGVGPEIHGIAFVGDDCATESFPCIRSEEHTSELQSRRDLVCRLLLEKKKDRYVCFQPQRTAACSHVLVVPLLRGAALFPYTTLFRSLHCSSPQRCRGFG